MTYKDLPQSLIDAVKAVQKQTYDAKVDAVAIIKKNLERGAITPEIAQAQLHTWGEASNFKGFRPIPNDGPRQTTPHAPIALTAAYSKTGKAGGPLAMTGGLSSTPSFRRVDKLRSLDKKPLIGHRNVGENVDEARVPNIKKEMLGAIALPLLPRVIPSDPKQFDQFAEELTKDITEVKIDWKRPAKAGKENRPKSGTIHPMGVHVATVSPSSNGNFAHLHTAYRVKAVGRKVRNIKLGELLTDTNLDDLTELGHKIKSVKEDYFETMSDEEALELFETLSANEPASKWIDDFVHSKNPKFDGKSKAKRIKMALAAHYGAQKEQVDEGKETHKSRWNKMKAEASVAVKARRAQSSEKYAVLSQQHPIDDPDNISGPIHFHGHGLTHEKAHKIAKKVHKKELSKYPKGYYSDHMGNEDNYHIVAENPGRGEDKPAHSTHVVKMHNMKECSFDGKVFNVLDEVKIDRALGHTLLKKWKDMSPVEQARMNQLLKKKSDQKPLKKEDVEADQNILVHLRKSIDTEGKHETEFLTGEKFVIPEEVALVVLNHIMKLKPEDRSQVQEYLQQSPEHVAEVFKLIMEGARRR